MTASHSKCSEVCLRVLVAGVCAPFLVSGITQFVNVNDAARDVAALGLPNPHVVVNAIVALEICGALLTIFGRGTPAAFGSLVLALFTMLATVVVHSPVGPRGETRPNEATIFFEHVSIAFALLLIAWGHARAGGIACANRHSDLTRR